ncbi:MAG: HAD family hydrolase [Leptothrix sp. (in: b-proteobacteria)]
MNHHGTDRGAELRAVLFDMDGTLIDSMPLHERSWILWHAELELPFDDPDGFFHATAGRTNLEILRDHWPDRPEGELHELAHRKEQLFREIAARELTLIGGAAEVCAQARERGLKVAVCTAAPPENIAVAFERFGLAALVDTVTSPADGLRGKPHPDIFAEAARRLGVSPDACLVFEDAPLGIEAARRAGMAAVVMTTTLPGSAFASYPNVIDTLADYTGYVLPTHLPPKPPGTESRKEHPHA